MSSIRINATQSVADEQGMSFGGGNFILRTNEQGVVGGGLPQLATDGNGYFLSKVFGSLLFFDNDTVKYSDVSANFTFGFRQGGASIYDRSNLDLINLTNFNPAGSVIDNANPFVQCKSDVEYNFCESIPFNPTFPWIQVNWYANYSFALPANYVFTFSIHFIFTRP